MGNRSGKLASLWSFLRFDTQELFTQVALLVGIAGIAFAINSFLLTRQETKQVDLATRIGTLTNSLNSAAKTIGEIEEEIGQRQALVQKLNKDAETASRLAAMNREQLDAVAQVLKAEIEKESARSFWGQQGWAFFYTLLGVGLTELYRFMLRKWRARRLAA